MTTARAALWTGARRPHTIEDIEFADLRPGEIRVRTTAASSCVTDAFMRHADFPGDNPCPQILGHAAIGVVEAVGCAVDRIRVGDRVLGGATPQCGTCFYCLRNQASQCEKLTPTAGRSVAKRLNGAGVAAMANVGAFAELIQGPEDQFVALRTDLPDRELSLLGCGLTTGLGAALFLAPVDPGATVAVIGCGACGLAYVEGARIAGASRIVAIDPLPQRRAVARRLGATDVIDPHDLDFAEPVPPPTAQDAVLRAMSGWDDPLIATLWSMTEGRGVDFAFEATGRSDSARIAFAAARRAGHVVLSSLPTDFQATVELPVAELALASKSIHGCQWGGVHLLRDIASIVRLMEGGYVDTAARMSRPYRLEEVDQMLDAAEQFEDVTGVMAFS